jgi:ureidoglycolate lyase/seryl-tRNA synthetase
LKATPKNFASYGRILNSRAEFDQPLNIVQWPSVTGRPVIGGRGAGANLNMLLRGIKMVGTGETPAKRFTAWWTNDKCHEVNEAVNATYLLGTHTSDGSILTTDTNVHPDGDQAFWPLNNTPFIVLLSINADETRWSPFDFVAFYFDGSKVIDHIHLFELVITGRTDQSRR